jgi:putative membrane protein
MEVFTITTLVYAILLLVVAKIVPGIEIDGFGTAIVAGLVMGVVNALIKPIIVFLSLPFVILTLGIFLLVINALLLKLAAAIVPGFRIKGFGSALLGALLLSIFSGGLSLLF